MLAFNAGLATAFPVALRGHALAALEVFPEPTVPSIAKFFVKVAGEVVAIPYRLYCDPSKIVAAHLMDLEKEIVHCLLTRHNDGFVRQHHLARIVCSRNAWVPPFVIQLLGEYVIEITGVIHDNLSALDRSCYKEFIRANPEFLTQIAQRVASYWDCYYRVQKKEEYVGFKVLEFFKALVG